MATQATLAVLRKRGAAAGVRVPRALNSKSVVDVQRPTWYPYDGTEVASKFRAPGNERADLSELVKVAVRIQAVFRGFRARKYATKVFHRKVLISKPAFLKVANEIKRLHLGWNHFCIHTVLFALVLCLAYFQFLAYRPSAHSQEYALLRALGDVSTSDGVGFADISSLAEAKAFVRSMAQIMAHPDPYPVASLQERPSGCDFESCQGLDLDQLISQCSLVTEYSGFLDQYNRHQVGLVVSQTRREFETCRATFDDSFESIGIYESGPANTSRRCTRTKSSASTFESDITDAAPEILQNFSLFGVNPFKSDSENVFTAVVDLGLLNLPQGFMDCALSYLFEDVHWVDQATSELCASVVVQNLNAAGRYGYMQACFRTDVGGLVSPKVVVHSAQQASKGLRAGSVFLACVYALTIFAAGVLFSRKLLRKLHCRIGRCRARSARSLSWLGLGFEVTTLLLHLIVLIRFLQFESSSRQFQPFAGSYATTVLLGVREIVQFVQEVTFTMRIYAMLLIFMVIRTVQHLDFHPDTGIISRTLSRSASDILSFLFVYLVVVLSYAFIGLLMYSPYGEAFGSYFDAVTTLLFVSMGEFDATMDIIFSDSIEGDVWISQIYFWTYVFFTTLVLFNILLSIVVESFVSFQESSRASPTISFLQSMYLSGFITLYDVRNYHIPVAVGLAYRICAWCGLSHGKRNTASVSEPQSLSSQATNHDPPTHLQGGDRMGLSSPTYPETLPKTGETDAMSVVAGSFHGNLSPAGTTTAATAATVAARSSPITSGEEDKVNQLRSSAGVSSPISYEDLEALEIRHELKPDPPKMIDFGKNDSLGLSLLFNDGVSIGHLTTHPHRYDERLQFLRIHVAGSVPTFALRQELLQAFPESMAERLLWLFRQRTEELRPSDAREEVDMLFSESASQLYIIDQLKQVTNRLNAIAGHQQRQTVRTKEGQSGSISQLDNQDTELASESSLRSTQ